MTKWIGAGLVGLLAITVAMLARARALSKEAPIDTSKISKADAQALTKAWTDADFKKLVSVASRARANPSELWLVMTAESGGNPAAVNRTEDGYPGAVGLIQFTQSSNGLTGLSEGARIELPSKSVAEQLPYVDRYFQGVEWTKAGRAYPHAGAVYEAVFAPGRMLSRGTSDETVLYDQKNDAKSYAQNRGLDFSNKGSITVGDLVEYMRRVSKQPTYLAGLARLREVTGDKTLSPDLIA